tara:strand:- start:44 stop:196 length:153 start_codon:yes stop_codon:yes gene_type:complete
MKTFISPTFNLSPHVIEPMSPSDAYSAQPSGCTHLQDFRPEDNEVVLHFQ